MTHISSRTATLILLAALSFASAAFALDPLPPVECADGTIIVQDRPSSALFEGDGLDPAFCPDLGIELNNLGWRSTDRLLYGVELTSGPNGNNGLVRVGGDCQVQFLGDPLPASGVGDWPSNERVDAGEISTDGSRMYLHTGGLSRLYVLDLDPIDAGRPATLIDIIDFSASGNVHDWAFHPAFTAADAMLFGGDSTHGEVAVLDLTTGDRMDFPAPIPSGTSFGGASFNPDGNLVLHQNSGTVYELDVSDLDDITVVESRPGRSSGYNDATSCQQEEVGSCDEAYFMQDVGAKLFRTDTSSSNFTTVTELCNLSSWQFDGQPLDPVSTGLELNNMCYRGQDRMLYALELTKLPNGNNGLVRFAPDSCSMERVDVQGLPTDQRFDAGDCTADGQAMLVNIGGVRNKFYRIDLSTMTASKVEIRRPTPNANWVGFVHDWAYNPADGKFYGGDNTHGQIATLDIYFSDIEGKWIGYRQDRNLAGGARLPRGNNQLDAYGGAWFNSAGNLVLHRNDGSIFEIDVATRQVVDTSSSRSSGYNDGAACVGF